MVTIQGLSLPKVIHVAKLHEMFQMRTMDLGKHQCGPMVLVQICGPLMCATGLWTRKRLMNSSRSMATLATMTSGDAEFETTLLRPACSIKHLRIYRSRNGFDSMGQTEDIENCFIAQRGLAMDLVTDLVIHCLIYVGHFVWPTIHPRRWQGILRT